MKSLTLCLGLFLLAGSVYGADKRPNILMIAIDDLNDWVGAFGGHPQAQTPNIDRLASNSMVFRNASCPGPVCGPSRSALLSGFMPSTTGVYGNSNNMLNSAVVQTHATLPEYFSKHGYKTISSGKIFHKHSTESGIDHGQWAYDVWEGETGGGGKKMETFYSRNKGIIAGKKIKDAKFAGGGGSAFEWAVNEGDKEVTKDYRTAKWFESQLQQDHEKPFFMLAGISKPHLPFIAPQEFYDLYDLDTIKVPEYRLDDLEDIIDDKGKPMFSPSLDFLWIQHYGLHKEVVRAYLAATSYADACVGVMLDALGKSPYADNTIVVLWGDHGWHLGEKLRFRKATLWKDATQLPLMIHVPGMDQEDCYRNVNLIDLYPTLIELCGLPEKELDGKSFKPLLENAKLEWDPTVTTMGKGSHSVMSEKWHYIRYQNGVEELYHIEKDPMEWENLARSKSPEVKKVKNWLSGFLPEKEADEIFKDRNGAPMGEVDRSIKKSRDLGSLK